MKFNKKAFDMICAEKCLYVKDVAEKAQISATTIQNAHRRNLVPATIGKIARALEVPVTSIIIDEADHKEVTAL